MPDQFLQAVRLDLPLPVNIIQYLIKDRRLLAGGATHALRIEHRDQRKDGSQRKKRGIKTQIKPAGDGQGRCASGMARRHAAGADEPTKVKTSFREDADDDLKTLSDEPDRQCDDQNFIGQNIVKNVSHNVFSEIKLLMRE